MNYLAHFYLSFEQEPLIVGNLLGDFVRGHLTHPRNDMYPESIKKGIRLHRHIDSFTDTHPIIDTCRSLLPAKFGHYKGVVMDMYFDYFLAKNFTNYHTKPLKQFSQEIYTLLKQNEQYLPEEARLMVGSMIKYDWLTHYQYQEGMRRSFVGMSKRFEVLKGIDEAADELTKNEDLYAPLFLDFFPKLVGTCKDFLQG